MTSEATFTKTLYARNSNGTIQQWTIEVFGNQYRTVSGRHNGQMVVSAFTTAKPKNVGKANETTPEDQALAEAQSKVRAKLDEGYNEDITKIDDLNFIQVMTCSEFTKRVKHVRTALDRDEPVWMQPKLDGHRAVILKDRVQSRGGKEVVSVPHILEAFAPVREKYPNIIPDGELYNHLLHDDFDTLSSVIRKQKPTEEELAKSREIIQFHWYDIVQLDHDKTEMKFSERHKWIHHIMGEFAEHFAQFPYVCFVYTKQVFTMTQIDETANDYLEMGYEGSIIRFDTPYERREKSLGILKHKPFIDSEFTIVGVKEGRGSREGAAKLVCLTEHGVEFEAALKCTVQRMQEIYGRKEEMLGKQATVRYGGSPGYRIPPGKRPRWPRVIGIRDVF